MALRMRHILVTLMTLAATVRVKADEMDDCKPQQTHLAYGRTTREMVVMWSTVGQCTTTVKWSDKDMWSLDQSTPGESRLFDLARNEDGVQILHRVELTNLPAGKTIYYQPESNGVTEGKWFFRTPKDPIEITPTTPAPAPAPTPYQIASIDDDDGEDWSQPDVPTKRDAPTPVIMHEKVEFFVVSDLKTSSPAITHFNAEVTSGKYSAILHAGNLAMNLSSDGGKNADKYFNQIEPAVASVPYMTAPGELEIEDGFYSHYIHRLSMPDSEWPINRARMWYSFDLGLVHVISFSTDVFYTGQFEESQHNWLINNLKAANKNRHKVPWVVAFGREPLYCSYEDPDMACHQKISQVRKGLEDIFYTFGVDIVLQSAGRGYERSLPMYKGVAVNENYTNPQGPVFIVTGGAASWEPEFNFTSPAPEWLAFRITNHTKGAYGRLRLVNATTAEFEQVCLIDGTLLDSVTITQEQHGAFSTESLPPNITKEIEEEMESRGEKPATYGTGELNIEEIGDKNKKTGLTELLKGGSKTRVIIGATFGSFFAVCLLIIVYIRRTRRKSHVTRRWEHMDINYGKRFYDKAPDQDDDHDFEIDMVEDTEPSRKLLSDD